MRKAASVVLLRKNKGKVEVLMAQRSKTLKAFGGAFVFPGGVVEAGDGPEGSMEQLKRCGLRELFEEVGVLLAFQGAKKSTQAVHFATSQERIQWQTRVKDNAAEFDALLADKRVQLATDSLFHLVHFTTPVMEPKRFATDFFVVDSGYNEGDMEFHESETTSLLWITPEEAIARNRRGEMPFLPPQFFCLQMLTQLGSTPGQIIKHLSQRDSEDEPMPIMPHPVGQPNGPQSLTLCYPGDEQHPDYPVPGKRHRIHVSLPMGKSGFEMESTLGNNFLTKRMWKQLQAKL